MIPYLTYIDGSFDDNSLAMIDKIDSETNGFKDWLFEISENFYSFSKNIKTAKINYIAYFKDVAGKALNVKIMRNISLVTSREELEKLVKARSTHYAMVNKKNMSTTLQEYFKNRDELIKKHPGKYASISEKYGLRIKDNSSEVMMR